MKNLLMLTLLVLTTNVAFSQNIKVNGIVQDSLQNPLEYANILAVPESENADVRFAITNNKGDYELKLEQNQSYQLTISYLGYVSKNPKCCY